MALRRIRLQSLPPLPCFRVWFLVPQSVADVHALKLAFCTQLPTLKEAGIQPAQLVLELDEFEIPEESSIDLVHEGDILMLKRRDLVAPLDTLKRRASSEGNFEAEKRRRLSICTQDSSDSVSNSSLASSSSSVSSASSSSDSDLDSSPSAEHSTSFLSESQKPQPQHALLDPLVAHSRIGSRAKNYHTPQAHTVPPGLGKASTHSRNRRRRIKRKFAATQSVSPKMTSSNLKLRLTPDDRNDISLQSRDDALAALYVQSSLANPASHIHSTSLGNKSSKGFIKAVEGVTPQKVFVERAILRDSPAATPSFSALTFIPPSDREDLPENIFVTSIDVEWRTGQGSTFGQDIDDVEKCASAVSTSDSAQEIDWNAIEMRWNEHEKLDMSVTLSEGTVVAWKAFGLDPVTLSPQAHMLHVGKVVSVDPENLLIQPLTRPGSEQATFGRTIIKEDCGTTEQISLLLKDVCSNGWRLVSLPTVQT